MVRGVALRGVSPGGVIMVSAFITSIAASFYPTYSLVRKQPVEILRFQFR